MRQMRLYKSSRITLLSYLVSQLYTVIFNPCLQQTDQHKGARDGKNDGPIRTLIVLNRFTGNFGWQSFVN